MTIEKLRSYRIAGIALFDLILSAVGMIIIFWAAKRAFFKELDTWKFIVAAILLTIPIGIFFHVITGRNTSLNYNLGLSHDPKSQ